MTVLALMGLATFTSCNDCKSCTGESVSNVFLNDSLISTSNSSVSAQEFCGEDLEVIEDNPEVTTESEQNVGGMTQRSETTITYTCE